MSDTANTEANNDGPLENPVVVGRIGARYGVKGWLRIASYTDPPDALLEYPHWWIQCDGCWALHRRQSAKRHGKGLVAKFAGLDDRSTAAAWVGRDIAVARVDLVPTGQDEYYWDDLIGLRVVSRTGHCLGVVDHLLETGAHDVLVVRSNTGEVLIPFAPGNTIDRVDLAAGEVVADWDWLET